MAVANPADWRPGTKQWIIAEALVRHGMNRKRAHSADIRPMVVAQIEPMIFRNNSGLPYAVDPDQCRKAYYLSGDVARAIQTYGWDREAGEAAAIAEMIEAPIVEAPAQIEVNGFDPVAELKYFVSEVRRVRDWLPEFDAELDHLSYRPIKDGRKMIEAGIPAKACLYAMTLHWDEATRRMAGIADYDPASEFPGGLRAYLDTLVKARVHIFLYGEAGFGKSYWAEQLADRLGVDFGQIPCNEGVSPSWFVGKDTATGYKPSRLVDLLPKPSVYLFDEVDRSESNLLVLINGVLANRTLANPITGEDVVQHEDCILVFAGNSLGHGSNKYLSANELDPSTLDRTRMGRVEIGYDREVEDLIAFG